MQGEGRRHWGQRLATVRAGVCHDEWHGGAARTDSRRTLNSPQPACLLLTARCGLNRTASQFTHRQPPNKDLLSVHPAWSMPGGWRKPVAETSTFLVFSQSSTSLPARILTDLTTNLLVLILVLKLRKNTPF